MENNTQIPVIDLFAGPGGLAEGFSNVINGEERVFNIGLSVEKDGNAHKTLLLRSFLRQFPFGKFPKEYYEVLQSESIEIREKQLELLFESYPPQLLEAQAEAIQHELGKDDDAIIDSRIREKIGSNKNWVLIGGPPCQAYSLAGRSRVGGISKNDHRVYLYKEYLRVIAKHKPAVFVMENVKGLLSAKIDDNSVFDMIVDDLENPSKVFPKLSSPNYKVYSLVTRKVKNAKDYLIKSEDYGVPQKRHRVILIGVRIDIDCQPKILTKKSTVSVEEAIGDLPRIRSSLNRKFKKYETVYKDGVSKKMRRYTSVDDTDNSWNQILKSHIKEIQTFNGFKDLKIKKKSPKIGIGAEFLHTQTICPNAKHLSKWFYDKSIKGVINHVSRSHLIEDLKRYYFASWYSELYLKSPKLSEYKSHSKELMPDHLSANSGKFADRFRVQIKEQPATTITSHISKDGHYFIHYDKEQNRSLTVREASRIQTFPDNYLFRGSRTQQYHQVGNAVPPYLAFQIGNIVNEIFEESCLKTS